MKIEIKCGDQIVTLDNDFLDNDNFIDLVIDGKHEVTVPIDELYSAILAFQTLKDEQM